MNFLGFFRRREGDIQTGGDNSQPQRNPKGEKVYVPGIDLGGFPGKGIPTIPFDTMVTSVPASVPQIEGDKEETGSEKSK